MRKAYTEPERGYALCELRGVMYSTGKQREQGQEEEDSEKMIGLLYCPSLLDRTVELVSKRLSELVLSEAKSSHVIFMAYILPKLTLSVCSPELFSEHDTRDYCNTVLVRPSLATMQVVETGGIPSRFKSTDSSTDLYVTSGFKKKVALLRIPSDTRAIQRGER